MGRDIERAVWVDWWNPTFGVGSYDRIYFGHETCEKLLPTFESIDPLLEFAGRKGIPLTYVTPFLTENGLHTTISFLTKLKVTSRIFEVVTSDWGLLDWVCTNAAGIPVVSRFLVGQYVDPRISRILNVKAARDIATIQFDGSFYFLRQIPATPSLRNHLCSCSLSNSILRQFFLERGIRRMEVSNVPHDIALDNDAGISFSLHVPYIPLAVMRSCPGEGEDFNSVRLCNPIQCRNAIHPWSESHIPCRAVRKENALYYRNHNWPAKVTANPCINRVVFTHPDERDEQGTK